MWALLYGDEGSMKSWGLWEGGKVGAVFQTSPGH